MKKHLFGGKSHIYKANLHAHSTGSDGKMPPEKMKEEFKKHGYDILCITEHEILHNYSYLSEKDFLMLNGFEISANEKEGEHWSEGKCCHINLYATDESMTKTVCYNPKSVFFADDDVKNAVEYIGEINPRIYSADSVNDIIKIARDNGFIACLNHPTWSMETPFDYLCYDGLFALEIYNTDCVFYGWEQYDITAYDLFCKAGKRLAVQMADDNHNTESNNYFAGTFGGFDMISCDSLDYKSVITALENGDFYGSQGPEIFEIYTENDEVHIITAPCADIIMSTGIRHVERKSANTSLLTQASFSINDRYKYIRFEVRDENQKRAYSRAYFNEEW